jgi:hypothetical protein
MGGRLLNKQAKHNNSFTLSRADDAGTNTGKFGAINALARIPKFQMGIATILPVTNDCVTGSDPREGTEPPCIGKDLYRAKFSWYDHGTGEWVEDVREGDTTGSSKDADWLPLDAGGYWEGRITRDDKGRETGYDTDASRDMTSGPGFGPIPLFREGDKVPAYYDRQRGMLIPVVSPPADISRASFVYQGSHLINDATLPGFPKEETVVAFVEVKDANSLSGEWQIVEAICIRVPFVLAGEDWCDSRSAFGFFESSVAEQGHVATKLRVRVVSTASFDVTVKRAQVHLYGAGRLTHDKVTVGDDPFHFQRSMAQIRPTGELDGGSIIPEWFSDAYVQGRFRDQPRFFQSDDQISIDHQDHFDKWVIGFEFSITIAPEEGGFSTSSSSSTSSGRLESSMSSLSVSDSSQSMSESSYSVSMSSQSIPEDSSDSSSSIIPTSGISEHFCCVTLVADIECDETGLVTKVCYQTICYPVPPGIPASYCKSDIWCVECKMEESSQSGESSSLSTSSESSALNDILCPEVPLIDSFPPLPDPGDLPDPGVPGYEITKSVVIPRETNRIRASGGGVAYSDVNTYIGGEVGDVNQWYISIDEQNAVFGVTANTVPTVADNNQQFEYGLELRWNDPIRLWTGNTFIGIPGTTHQSGDLFTFRH